MKVDPDPGGSQVTAKLHEGDDVFTLLRSRDPELRGFRRTLSEIKDSNPDVMKRRKLPWWVGAGDKLVLKKAPGGGGRSRAKPAWRHHHRLHGIPQVIDVYLGFMDEEVNARLARLIDEEKTRAESVRRPVILIERKKVEPGKPLLEWSIGNYEVELRKIVNVSPAGEMVLPMEKVRGMFGKEKTKKVAISPKPGKKDEDGEDASPEMILARFMALTLEQDLASDLDWLERGLKVKRYADVIKLLQHQIKYSEGKKRAKPRLALPEVGSKDTTSGPWLSVVRFDIGNDALAPIVVIRTPEMGLQPSLMSPYIGYLFKALSALGSQLAYEDSKKGGLARSTNGAREVVPRDDQEGGEKLYEQEPRKRDLWEWPLRVSEFGAHGSTTRDLPPGTTVTVVASLFAGIEIDSTVVVEAKEKVGFWKRKEREFVYGGTEDSTESRPEWMLAKHEGRYALAEERYQASEVKDTKKRLPPVQEGRVQFEKVQVARTHGNVDAVVSLCTPAGVYEFLRVKIDEEGANDLRRIELAQKRAKRALCDERDALVLEEGVPDDRSPFAALEQNLTVGTSLADAIAELERAYGPRYFQDADPPGIVSLTLGYFGGEEDKKAADELGIRGVNMEDYHVLRVLRSAVCQGGEAASDYPMILDWRVDRINCDPKVIEGEVQGLFQDWIVNDATMSVGDYVDVVMWGLGGVLESQIPGCSRWSLVGQIARQGGDIVTQRGRHLLVTHLYSAHAGPDDPLEDYIVPNPFHIEIGTDFVAELSDLDPSKAEPGGISLVKQTLGRRHSASASRKILEDVRAKASAVRKAKDPAAAARTLVQTLVVDCGLGVTDFVGDLVQLEAWRVEPGVVDGIDRHVLQAILERRNELARKRMDPEQLAHQVERALEHLNRKRKLVYAEVGPKASGPGRAREKRLIEVLESSSLCRDAVRFLIDLREKAVAVRAGKQHAPERLWRMLDDWNLTHRLCRLKTWLRPMKWGPNENRILAPTLQDLGGAGFDDLEARDFGAADIDRAFYKSSNMMALQKMAGRFLWKGGDEPIPTIGGGP